MSKGNSRSTAAYIEARKGGASKEEAKAISTKVYEKSCADDHAKFMGKSNNYEERAHDFDSDINGNGTDWHTADDL